MNRFNCVRLLQRAKGDADVSVTVEQVLFHNGGHTQWPVKWSVRYLGGRHVHTRSGV